MYGGSCLGGRGREGEQGVVELSLLTGFVAVVDGEDVEGLYCEGVSLVSEHV
jgi:hypothetical protein